MRKFQLNINRDLLKSWAIVTIIWVSAMAGLMFVSGSTDAEFCLKIIPEQYPECRDVVALRERQPDLLKTWTAITLVPPILILLPILFRNARAR